MTASFEHIGMLGFDVFGTVVDWRTSVAVRVSLIVWRWTIRRPLPA